MTVLSSEDNHLPIDNPFIQYLRQNEPNSSDYKTVKIKIENVKTKIKKNNLCNFFCRLPFYHY